MSAEILEGPVYLDDSHHSEKVRRMRRVGDEIAELSAHLAAAILPDAHFDSRV